MNLKENISCYATKLIGQARITGKRRLSDMTNFDKQNKGCTNTLNRLQSKPGKIQDIKLLNRQSKKYISFPCYDERYLRISKDMAIKLKKRHQDDDCESEEELVEQSIYFNLDNLLKATGEQNEKKYNIADYYYD